MNKLSTGFIGAVVALVLFLAVNVLANASLRTLRVDLTEQKLFTLSEGSKQIARDLDEPIRFYLYFSEGQAREIPQIKDYADRVRDVLEEFVLHSNGNLILEMIDPEPFSEEEERAAAEGIFALPIPGADTIYFGLVATNATDGREVLPYFDAFDAEKERFLEYDISRIVYTLAHPDKNKVGILSSLPIGGGPPSPMIRQPQPRWKIIDHLEGFFVTEMVEPTADELPDDLDVLVLIHPKDLPEATLYLVDQYVLAGGKLVVFVDPHCQVDQSGVNPNDPMSQFGASRASGLKQLFEVWGLELVDNKIAGDRKNALRARYQAGQQIKEVPYVVWMMLREDEINREDVVTSLMDLGIFLDAPGVLRPRPEATTTFTPLVQTSEEAMEIDAGTLQFAPDPETLFSSFVSGFQRLTVAARISGEVGTAFPEGPPDAVVDAETEEGEDVPDMAGPDADGHLGSSQGPINVIVAADVDMLTDARWIREQTLLGMSLGYQKTTDNADFLVNSIENLLGGEELISIRPRGSFSRPFERVEEIQRVAEQRYLQEEQDLERKLQEAEQRINQLQTERSGEGALILSAEQKDLLDKANEEVRVTKRQLRDVKHNLRKDIERLGTRLKWLNILAIPALVTAAAVALGAWRIQRRGK